MFQPTSRYYGIATGTITTSAGQTIVYTRRRFIPPASQFSQLQTHAVIDGERLDNITAEYMGDPQQFWRVCDGNGAMYPDDLTAVPGRQLRITLPQGVPLNKNS